MISFASMLYYCILKVIERPPGLVIDHKDGNKLNNRADNLRYVTATVNNRNRRDLKLNEELVGKLRAMLGTMPQVRIAELFGISQSTQSIVSNIVTGKRWAEDGRA